MVSQSDKDCAFPISFLIMQNLEGNPENRVGGHNISNLRYSDDTVLIAVNLDELQQRLDIVEEETERKGWN